MDRYESLRAAVGALTAACLDDEHRGTPLLRYLERELDGGPERVADLLYGSVELCRLLLAMRADELGVPELETLRGIAEATVPRAAA